MDARIAEILEFLDNSLNQDITPRKAARKANLSYSHFAALFREDTGKRFREFLREKRIAKAQALLRNPGPPIKEVCFLMGYRHIRSFYRDFKKITGRTPGQFKKESKSYFLTIKSEKMTTRKP
jgi:two-component system response regulator YesN